MRFARRAVVRRVDPRVGAVLAFDHGDTEIGAFVHVSRWPGAAEKKAKKKKAGDDDEKFSADLDNDLPVISRPHDIFADIVRRFPEIGELAKSMDRPLRVATMCSGTESPLLALEMISKACAAAFGAGSALKAKAQTLSLSTLVTMEMLKALSAVSLDHSLLRVSPLANKWLLAGVAAGLLGIGGGMVIGPLFVDIGLEPQVGGTGIHLGKVLDGGVRFPAEHDAERRHAVEVSDRRHAEGKLQGREVLRPVHAAGGVPDPQVGLQNAVNAFSSAVGRGVIRRRDAALHLEPTAGLESPAHHAGPAHRTRPRRCRTLAQPAARLLRASCGTGPLSAR